MISETFFLKRKTLFINFFSPTSFIHLCKGAKIDFLHQEKSFHRQFVLQKVLFICAKGANKDFLHQQNQIHRLQHFFTICFIDLFKGAKEDLDEEDENDEDLEDNSGDPERLKAFNVRLTFGLTLKLITFIVISLTVTFATAVSCLLF